VNSGTEPPRAGTTASPGAGVLRYVLLSIAVVVTAAWCVVAPLRDGAAEPDGTAQRIVATAYVAERPTAVAAAGDTIEVPIRLDMAAIGSTGDLGAVQLDLHFDPNLLRFVDARPGIAGQALSNLRAPGTLAFALVSLAPHGSSRFVLVNVRFQVAEQARGGQQQQFRLEFTAAPVSTTLQEYASPEVRNGSLRIGAGD
jgi:hypothetical protein